MDPGQDPEDDPDNQKGSGTDSIDEFSSTRHSSQQNQQHSTEGKEYTEEDTEPLQQGGHYTHKEKD